MRLLKKITGGLVLTALVILSLCACGSSDSDTTEETETSTEAVASFYSLENSSKRLKVELETDTAAGYSWTYKVSDEKIINLAGFDVEPGDSEDGTALGTWKGTFAATGTEFGDAKIMLYYVLSSESVETAGSTENTETVGNTENAGNGKNTESTEPVYILDVTVSADGTITVNAVTE